MPEPDVVLVASVLIVIILLVSLAASIRIVREGEFMAVFRLGRAWRVFGPGLAALIPVTDRPVRVSVPVGMLGLRVANDPLHPGGGPASQQVPGHPGLTMTEVCLRAAVLARQGNPRTRRATVEQFEEALRGLAPKEGRTAW